MPHNPTLTTGKDRTMRHCTDCRFYAPARDEHKQFAKCTRQLPDPGAESPIHGGPMTEQERLGHPGTLYCNIERFGSASFQCGPEARFYEPRTVEFHDYRDGASTAGNPAHDLDVAGRALKAGS